MAHLFINRCTHTVRISFIIKWCWNSSHISSYIIYNLINLSSVHAFMYCCCNRIKACYIYPGTLFNLLNLSSENVFRSNWALYPILFHPNTLALR